MLPNWRAAPVLAAALLSSAFAVNGALAAQAQCRRRPKEYTPSVGQEGKDVIWVPTPQALVERMLQMAGTKSTDYVVDLGSGDGRTVITAVKKFGAHRARHRIQPRHGRAREARRREGRRRGQGAVHAGRHLPDRFQQGDRAHAVPAAVAQREAAPDDPQHEARHARRLARLHDGRLAGRPGRLRRRPHRLHVDRPRESRGHVENR